MSAQQTECSVSMTCRCTGKADVRVTCSVVGFPEPVWTLSEVCLCDSRQRNAAKGRWSVSCLVGWGESCDSVSAFVMCLFSGLQLCHAVRSGVTTRCPLHALLLRPASDPAPELPGAQRPVGPELGQPGEQRHQQHRRAHPQRPDPAAPVPAAGVSGPSRGASAVEAGAACLSARHSVFRASCVSGVSRPWVRCALWWESAVSACPPGCSRLR